MASMWPGRSSSHLSCSTSPRCAREAELLLLVGRLRAGPAGAGHAPRGGTQDAGCRQPRRTRRAASRTAAAAAASLHSGNGSQLAGAGTARATVEPGQRPAGGTGEADAAARTEFVAETLLPTASGKYRLRGYRHTVHIDGNVTVSEPSVIMTGQPEGQEDVVVRVHDACFTSEVLGSLKCDCADQLQLAMDYIQDRPGGLIIYLQQEGRGIGLANKIAAYALQEQGLDTVDANRRLGLPDDAREYTSVRNILADLGIKSIRLMTNNPRKIEVLRGLGVAVAGRLPCIVQAQQHNLGYLSTKRARMRHLLAPQSELDGSFCIWNHEGEPLPPSVLPEDSLAQPPAGPLGALVAERAAAAQQLAAQQAQARRGNGLSEGGVERPPPRPEAEQ